MLFLGIEVNPDKTYTIAQMDENRNITFISNFHKEGLIWFLDHQNSKIIAVDIPEYYSQQQQKSAFDVFKILVDIFSYKEDINAEKIAIKTNTDKFFSQLIRKALLPIKTREGLEQRIYNLPKAGIIVKPEMLSKDRNYIQREIGAIASAFAAYSIYNKSFQKEEENEQTIYIPTYKFIPRKDRIISK